MNIYKFNRILYSLTFGLLCMQTCVANAQIIEAKVCYFSSTEKYFKRYSAPVVYWKIKTDGTGKNQISIHPAHEGSSKPLIQINKGSLNKAVIHGTIFIPHKVRQLCQITTRTWEISKDEHVKGTVNGRDFNRFIMDSTIAGTIKRTPVDLDCMEAETPAELKLLGIDAKEEDSAVLNLTHAQENALQATLADGDKSEAECPTTEGKGSDDRSGWLFSE